jgi:hypothetical protein
MRKGAHLSVDGLAGDHDVPKIPTLAERGYPRHHRPDHGERTSYGFSERIGLETPLGGVTNSGRPTSFWAFR